MWNFYKFSQQKKKVLWIKVDHVTFFCSWKTADSNPLFSLAEDDIRKPFVKDPFQHVLLFFYVLFSAILEILAILIRRNALKGTDTKS